MSPTLELPTNLGKKVDRTEWRRVKFGEMAQCVTDRVDSPSEAGVDRYVGLEHNVPESLQIRRWGHPDDVGSTKLRFKPGDIIFGKRRAYQRKLAVADFDGICSAHAMVLRAKEVTVDKDYLPVFMQSDIFFERALSISVGSLSPTINWKELAAQEFLLPPMDEQRKIAALLWAVETLSECDYVLIERLTMVGSTLIDRFCNQENRKIALGELLIDIQYGTSVPSGAHTAGSVPVLRIPNVLSQGLTLTDLSWAQLSIEEQDKYKVVEGDILIVRTNGNPDYVGRSVTVPKLSIDTVFASYLIRLRVDPGRVHPEYVNAVLNSPWIRRTLSSDIRSSAGNYNLNTQGIKRQRIPLIPLDEQHTIISSLKSLRVANSQITRRRMETNTMKRSLIDHLLSGKAR